MYGRVVIVVGEEYLRLDDLCRLDTLVYRHRVRLVTGQEGDVDILEVGHLWDILRITSDVDSQAVEGEDIAVVAAFGMELCVIRGGVIGWYCFDADIIRILYFVAIAHHQSVLEVSEDSLIYVDRSSRRTDLVDSLTVEVILVLVGDEYDVGLWEGGIVGLGLQPHAYGIHLDLHTIVVDFHTGMLDASDGYFLAALGGKLIHLLCGFAPEYSHTGECDATDGLLHLSFIIGSVTMNLAPSV